jgi:hypothetical protein
MLRLESRKTQRSPAFLGAKIFFDNKPSTFDCLVKNISDEGAYIKIESIWDIPETFRLYIQKYGKSFECHVRWKADGKLGVSYS